MRLNSRIPRLLYQLTHTVHILLQVMNDEEAFLAGDVVEKDESTLSNTRVANQVIKRVRLKHAKCANYSEHVFFYLNRNHYFVKQLYASTCALIFANTCIFAFNWSHQILQGLVKMLKTQCWLLHNRRKPPLRWLP